MKNKIHFIRVLPFFCFLLVGQMLSAQISGAVFRDFNGNGTKEANEPLLPGVIVTAYDASNAIIASFTTAGAAAPNYSIPASGAAYNATLGSNTGFVSSGTPVRVEFVMSASGACVAPGVDYAALGGATYGSAVQFVNGNSMNVNFGIFNPGDYNTGTTGVNVFTPCYVNGDPLGSGTSGTLDWFVGFDYTDTGNSPPGGNAPDRKVNGTVIGATWGVAYSAQAGKIFTSAFLKRHVGLGAWGSGGIYLLEPTATSFNVTQFYDMDANGHRTRADETTAPAYGNGTSFQLNNSGTNSTQVTYLGANDPLTGLPEGLGVIGTNIQRGLSATAANTTSHDPAMFDQVGKVGLGDLEISDDGKYLFVMNLYQRRVFRLELDDAANPTSVVSVTSYPLPATNCDNGVLRPFALKYYRGSLYVGAVCSGENGGANTVGGATDLYAYVFKLDNPTGAAAFDATPVHSYALNFRRGAPATGEGLQTATQWYPWTRNTSVVFGTGFNKSYPQPVLSDIEFSDRGDLILGYFDRAGHQWGNNNRTNLSGSTNNGTYAAGDIIISGINCSTNSYVLENNGSYSSINGQSFTGSTNNNQGPGTGEFFNQESGPSTNNYHQETAQGGMSVLKGQGEVMTIAMDPLAAVDEGGLARLSTTNGNRTAGYTLYRGGGGAGLFGKANGLGDVEFSKMPAPIEIGNRVWSDTDNDGIQDADEPGISGIEVQLWKETTPGTFTQVATVTTNANGNYYFSNATGTSGPGITYDPDVQPNMNYELRFPLANGALSISTKPNMGGADANADARDADATAAGVIAFSTGNAGENNYSYDVAYAMASCVVTIVSATPSTCAPATNTYSLTVNVSWTNASGTTLTVSSNAPGATNQTITTTAGSSGMQSVTFTGLTANAMMYNVTAQFDAGCTATSTNAFTAPPACTGCPTGNCGSTTFLKRT